MYTDGRNDPSRLEDEYFYKKDRELIDKMKEEERQKKDVLERTQHYHKCSKCGHGMEERVREELSFLLCNHCECVHISLSSLESLSQPKQLKLLVSELRDQLKNLKESA